jgi:hypothetical protein
MMHICCLLIYINTHLLHVLNRLTIHHQEVVYSSVSQPPGRGPVLGLGINYTRAARGSPVSCHSSFLSIFHE